MNKIPKVTMLGLIDADSSMWSLSVVLSKRYSTPEKMSPIYCFLHGCSCCEFTCKNTDSNKLVMVLKLWFRFVLSNGDNYFLTSHDTSICSSRGTKVTFWGAADGAGGLREEGF